MLNIGIKLNLSSFSHRIKIDWKGILTTAVDTIKNLHEVYHVGDVEKSMTLSIAMSSLNAFFENIKIEKTPEGLLSKLFTIAIARTVTDLLIELEDHINHICVEDWDISEIISDFERETESKCYIIDSRFFNNFESESLIKLFKKTFYNWISIFIEDSEICNMLMRLFPYYFVKNLKAEWLNNSEQYPQISENIFTPFDTIEERYFLYEQYRQKLINMFCKEKTFNDSFPLSDIYIELPGYHKFIPNEYDKLQISYAIEIDCWIFDWINDKNSHNNVVLLSGNPGSGKSTILKRIASQLAILKKNIIWVPIYKFVFGDDIEKSIAEYMMKESELRINPFTNIDSENPLIILFDGLDEIAMSGVKSLHLAKGFIKNIINQFSGRLDIKIIISGRDMVIEENSFLIDGKNILHILPMYLDEDSIDKFNDPDGVLNNPDGSIRDRRPLWWGKYADIKGWSQKSIPEIFKDDEYDEITSHPLLSYLLAVCYESKQIDFSESFSINLLYYTFIKTIYERAWHDNKVAAKNFLSKISYIDFIALLEEIGLCSWHYEKKNVPFLAVKTRCVNNQHLSALLSKLGKSSDDSFTIQSVMLAFYFNLHHASEDEKAFEFSHKSFGEYLTAKKIVDQINMFIERLDPQIIKSNFISSYFNEFLSILIDLFAAHKLDKYIIDFLYRELESLYSIKDHLYLWRQIFLITYQELLLQDISVAKLPTDKIKDAFSYIRNVENSVLLILSLCGKIIGDRVEFQTAPTQLAKWISMEELYDSYNPEYEVYRFFCGLILKYHQFEEVSFSGFRFRNIEFFDCRYNDCYLSSVYLKNCDLIKTFFNYSMCNGMKMQSSLIKDSQFSGTSFKLCNFKDTNFENCKFNDVTFENCTISYCDFIKCEFNKTTFIKCNIKYVPFSKTCNALLFLDSSFECVTFDNDVSEPIVISSETDRMNTKRQR